MDPQFNLSSERTEEISVKNRYFSGHFDRIFRTFTNVIIALVKKFSFLTRTVRNAYQQNKADGLNITVKIFF